VQLKEVAAASMAQRLAGGHTFSTPPPPPFHASSSTAPSLNGGLYSRISPPPYNASMYSPITPGYGHGYGYGQGSTMSNSGFSRQLANRRDASGGWPPVYSGLFSGM
jgi:hypothetical protein